MMCRWVCILIRRTRRLHGGVGGVIEPEYDGLAVCPRETKIKAETFTPAEAQIGINGDARRHYHPLRGGGSGCRACAPQCWGRLWCGRIATSSFSLSLTLF